MSHKVPSKLILVYPTNACYHSLWCIFPSCKEPNILVLCLINKPRHPKLIYIAINIMPCLSMLKNNYQGDCVMEVPEDSQG